MASDCHNTLTGSTWPTLLQQRELRQNATLPMQSFYPCDISSSICPVWHEGHLLQMCRAASVRQAVFGLLPSSRLEQPMANSHSCMHSPPVTVCRRVLRSTGGWPCQACWEIWFQLIDFQMSIGYGAERSTDVVGSRVMIKRGRSILPLGVLLRVPAPPERGDYD